MKLHLLFSICSKQKRHVLNNSLKIGYEIESRCDASTSCFFAEQSTITLESPGLLRHPREGYGKDPTRPVSFRMSGGSRYRPPKWGKFTLVVV